MFNPVTASIIILLSCILDSVGALPPSPPWTFRASKIHYQFRSVPVESARKSLSSLNPSPDVLSILSFGGYTLGGLFAVEYEDSPIGPYKEVAVLSALVAKYFSIGAWASHIFVDSNDAAVYGKKFWGLPATVVPIHFHSEKKIEMKQEMHGSQKKNDLQIFSISNDMVEVDSWNNSDNNYQEGNSLLRMLDVSLSSFSGCLPGKIDGGRSTPLLRYPLSIIGPRKASMSEAGDVICDCDGLLQEILQGGKALFSINVNDVRLKAGEPTVISS